MWASDLHMDFVLQRRFALDAKVPGDLRDQLSLFPVREDAIDVLTGNSSHGGKVGFPEVLSDYDTAALYRLTEGVTVGDHEPYLTALGMSGLGGAAAAT